MRIETIGDATLYLGDCLEILPTLDKVDAVVTDPPYGVGLGVGSGLRKNRKSKTAYLGFDDTREYVLSLVIVAIKIGIKKSNCLAVTPGFKCMWDYPRPKHTGSFQYAGSTVMSAWGPCLWQPVLYYGKDPWQGKLMPDSFVGCNDVDRLTDHPCPKPINQWTRLVARMSKLDQVVLDPFMGSGTTGVACANLGRKFIGIEIEPKYFDIACERIEAAQAQGRLFD